MAIIYHLGLSYKICMSVPGQPKAPKMLPTSLLVQEGYPKSYHSVRPPMYAKIRSQFSSEVAFCPGALEEAHGG